MALRLILGRAGTGKTTRMLGEIVDRLRQDPAGSPLIYLVPEQATFQAEYALATTPGLGGTIRAQVLSFGRLAYRLLQEVGGAAKMPVDDLGKQMVLRMLLEKHRDQLQVFHRSALQPGFAEQLARMISECKWYGLSWEELEQKDWGAGTLAQKLHDLRLIMQAYDEYVADRYYDTDDMLTRVADMIADSSYLREAEVWVDGFSGFTKQEYAILEQLMRHTKQVTVALCLDPSERDEPLDELSLFYPTLKTFRRLREMAQEAGVPVEEPVALQEPHRFGRSPWLGRLERHYFGWSKRPAAPPPARSGEVKLVTAANRRAEVQAVALRMLELVKEEGYRWRDMAVLLRDLTPYADEISGVFSEYGIPFFLDQKRTVLHHPLVELIRSALEVITTRWRYEAVFRCLKTDLLLPEADLPTRVARAEVDLLENYVLAYGINGSDWADEKPWQYHHRAEQAYDEIDRIRRRYSGPLLAFERQMRQAAAKDVRAMTAELYRFLCDLRVPQTLERWQREAEESGKLETAREHGQIWSGLIRLFDQVVEVMGAERISLLVYARILDSGLESIRLGLVPPALDQVVVGSMERSRQPDVKAVFVLGANDGVIPLRPAEGGILDEAERERLAEMGVELAPTAKQRLMAEAYVLYQALTRPSEYLWISCPLADEEGKALLPSPVFERVKDMLPGVSVWFFANQPTGRPEEDRFLLGRPKQVFVHLITLLRQMKKGTPLPPFWWDVYDWFVRRADQFGHERALLKGLVHTNRARRLPQSTSLALYGQELRMSVSRLERFQACPFSHFASHGLRLAERPLYKLERFDVGELFHASLKEAVERMNREGIDWASLTEADSMRLAGDVVDELVPATRASILSRTARYRFLTGKLKRAVGRAISVLGEHARRSRFAPVGLEIAFGPGGELPGLTLELDSGVTVHLLGRIDRVDQSVQDGRRFLRVIDYKSGAKALALSDVWNGLNLQLLVYLDVVVTHAKTWLGENAEVGGVFYYQVADPLITAKRMLTAEEVAKERAAKLKMKGLMLADTDLARLMDQQVESGSSDLLPFGLKKDGTFTAYSSVATAEQFAALQAFVRHSVKQISTRLGEGENAISPYAQGTALACQTCAFSPVCQFDPVMEGNKPRQLPKQKDEQIWTMIQETVASVDGTRPSDTRTSETGGKTHGDTGSQA